jgi:molecular chaperone GrpE
MESVSSPEIDKLSAKINELKASIAVVKSDIDAEQKTLKQLDDEYGAEITRVRKEFSRMKERSYEESTTISNKAKVDAVKEILPLGDNYQRARKVFQPLNSVEESQIAEEYDRLFESFNKVLEEFGVTKVSSLGEPFDVNFMEAIMTAPSTEYPQDVVCTEYQVGYRMGDMCVRPAMVVVSLGPGPPS